MTTVVPDSKVLDNFQRVIRRDFVKIQRGDLIKYSVDGDLRHGGHVIQTKLDEGYILLRNFKKKFSWRLYLTQLKLKVYKFNKKIE
jgi:hypothetical protein